MSATGWGGNTSLTVLIDLSQSTSIGSYTPDPNAPFYLWDSGLWDDTESVWQEGIVWTDVTSDVRSFSCSAGFERQNDSFNSSTATIVLDNRSGDYSPDNVASPYRVGNVTTIGMWRKVLVLGSYTMPNGVEWSFAIFSGYVQSWTEEFPDFGNDAQVSVGCVDVFAKIAAFDGFEQVPTGAGELSGARINRVLDNAGITDISRLIDLGTVTMQATSLSSNALDELKLVADSEGGALWAGPYFDIHFDGQYALIEKERSNTPNLVFVGGPSGNLAFNEITYNTISTSYDGDLVANSAAYMRVGGTVQEAVSIQSRAVYGSRQVSRTDLICETDAQALTLARRTVALNQQAERRIESLSFRPHGQPTAAAEIAAWSDVIQYLTLRALATVVLTTPHGVTMTRSLFVQGISHTITPDDWVIGLTFSSATEYLGYFSSRWDFGLFDTASWAW